MPTAYYWVELFIRIIDLMLVMFALFFR